MPNKREGQQGLNDASRPGMFFCTFICSTYFLSSTAALSTTTSATTADHDDHDKGVKTRRISSPLIFSLFNPPPTTTLTRQDVTSIISNDIRRVGLL